MGPTLKQGRRKRERVGEDAHHRPRLRVSVSGQVGPTAGLAARFLELRRVLQPRESGDVLPGGGLTQLWLPSPPRPSPSSVLGIDLLQ